MFTVERVKQGLQGLRADGVAEVLAMLPDDPAALVDETVFRPFWTVARTVGNSDLLDNLCENVEIGNNRKTNLFLALRAVVERPVQLRGDAGDAASIDAIKQAARDMYNASFSQRLLAEQRRLAPDLVFYALAAAILFAAGPVTRILARLFTQRFAMTCASDVSVATAIISRRRRFSTTFGALRVLLDQVARHADTPDPGALDLLPGKDTPFVRHTVMLLSKLDVGALEGYTQAQFDSLITLLKEEEERNRALEDSIDSGTLTLIRMVTVTRAVVEPICVRTQQGAWIVLVGAAVYWAAVLCRACWEVASERYGLKRHAWVPRTLLFAASALAMSAAHLHKRYSSVSVVLTASLCLAAVTWSR
jgi:hypothetical protein